jgi:hypothetical protein
LTVNLTGVAATTPLALLNNGAGVRFSAGNDFRITLRDGTQVNVDINGTHITLQDVLDAIAAAAPAGKAITATVSTSGYRNHTGGRDNLRHHTVRKHYGRRHWAARSPRRISASIESASTRR